MHRTKMYLKIFIIFLSWKSSAAVLYKLNGTEYERMPKLFSMENYDVCMLKSDAVYCLVDATLYSDVSSELMDMIHNYTAHSLKHYNHTQIHRGVCLTNTRITQFTKDHIDNTTATQKEILEGYLNDIIWNEYKLKVTDVKISNCDFSNKKIEFDSADIIVAVIYFIIIICNIIGSFYDFCIINREEKRGNPYLLSFSLFRNYRRLTAPGGTGPDTRLERLKLFNGLRAMTMICVFFSHTVLVMAHSYVENPQYIETAYEDPVKQILFNGTLVTFSFFTMSSFLLSYNMEIYAEKNKITWWQLPKGLLLRWLRLTPSYALIIATVCTWMRYLGSGPLWEQLVISESVACRKYFWTHVLYINNYVYDNALCFPQSWYLAADTQLFCLGLAICIAAKTLKTRKIVLSVLFVISLIIPAVQTYVQDLDAAVLQSPEYYRNLYATYPTFRYLFTSSHGNLSTYVLGLTAGLLAYRWQKNDVDVAPYRKYRWIYWSGFPLGVAVILSGGLFYIDGVEVHMAYKMLYAAVNKPFFQFIIITLLMGAVFKYENAYRAVMEWRGWAWVGRVSYSGFLLHSMFQRALVGSQRHPTYLSDYYAMIILAATIFVTFTTAAILWLLVEAPICQLVKNLINPPKHTRGQKEFCLTKVESDVESSTYISKV